MIKLKGTKFQLKVWNALKKLRKGKTKSYLDIAKSIGKPRAYRAVANAIANNPHVICSPVDTTVSYSSRL